MPNTDDTVEFDPITVAQELVDQVMRVHGDDLASLSIDRKISLARSLAVIANVQQTGEMLEHSRRAEARGVEQLDMQRRFSEESLAPMLALVNEIATSDAKSRDVAGWVERAQAIISG